MDQETCSVAVTEVCFAAAETGKGSEERGEVLFVVRIDLGNPFASVVEIGWVVVESPVVETEIQLAVVHNPSVVTKIRKHLGIPLAEMSKTRDAVRGNQWAGGGSPRQSRSAFED